MQESQGIGCLLITGITWDSGKMSYPRLSIPESGRGWLCYLLVLTREVIQTRRYQQIGEQTCPKAYPQRGDYLPKNRLCLGLLSGLG